MAILLTTFFEINATDTALILGYGKDFFGSALPIVAIAVGIGLGAMIIKVFF